MRQIFGMYLALASGLVLASQPVTIPVETFDVNIESAPRWEVFRAMPHEKAAGLMAAATKAGAACHELEGDSIVVCYYTAPASVGIDWEKLRQSFDAQSDQALASKKKGVQ
jgi:hypothetical protein